MCGIAGFIQRGPNPRALPRMLSRIVHRGPDGEGSWVRDQGGWHVALGHRRLSIIDVEGGTQPMEDPSGSAVIVYNGELYNFMDLRPDLERAGRPFRTRSDTEVILQHFQVRGLAGVPALDGMFAFAVWEPAARRLTLARDRTGIKPLYYAELRDGGLVFASELSALLAHGSVDHTLSVSGQEAETTNESSALIAQPVTDPTGVSCRWLLRESHIWSVPSIEAETMNEPSRLIAQPITQ